MLRTRVITAVILAAGMLLAIFSFNATFWGLLVGIISTLSGWEFARLAGFSATRQWVLATLVGAVSTWACLALSGTPAAPYVLGASGAFWALVVPVWFKTRWKIGPNVLAFVLALWVIVPTALAMMALRQIGPWWIVAAMLLISSADIAAYFAGRAFGRHKLAPTISPGKTWEGAWGAVLAVTALGYALASTGGLLQSESNQMFVLALLPLLTFLSIAGDLFESMLKRQAGMKDSSQLLPGHGGVLDRIDSYTSAMPAVTLAILHLRGVI